MLGLKIVEVDVGRVVVTGCRPCATTIPSARFTGVINDPHPMWAADEGQRARILEQLTANLPVYLEKIGRKIDHHTITAFHVVDLVVSKREEFQMCWPFEELYDKDDLIREEDLGSG
jgi:hypothetical protein